MRSRLVPHNLGALIHLLYGNPADAGFRLTCWINLGGIGLRPVKNSTKICVEWLGTARMAFAESWEKALNESSFTDDKDHASCTYARCE